MPQFETVTKKQLYVLYFWLQLVCNPPHIFQLSSSMLGNLIKTKTISVILMLFCICSCGIVPEGIDRRPQRVPRASTTQFPVQYPPSSYYYVPPPQPQQYYAPSPYQYQQPASRNYNNPYAVQRQNTYPYYDGDQYYVPPTYYGSPYSDNSAPDMGSQKF